ncbi:MAG: hypothetical protein HY884_05395 [Deltaproteobacteria bacterium]|nr:hypothetical protein [Deltaproteobacteria bacterium]
MAQKTQPEEKNQSSTQSNPDLAALEKEAMGFELAGERGAPDAAPEKPAVSLDPAILATFWKTLFSVVARNAGEHWALTEPEAAQLGALTVPVAEKWLPAVMNKYGAELVLATSVIFIVVPRIQKKKEPKKEDDKVG